MSVHPKPVRLLIIDYPKKNGPIWKEFFSSIMIKDKDKEYQIFDLRVMQWEQIKNITHYGKPKEEVGNIDILVNYKPNLDEPQVDEFWFDIVLIRKLFQGLKVKEHNYSSHLFALMHANIPCINSLESIFVNSERSLSYMKLKKIAQHQGYDEFPLIEQNFYSEPMSILFTFDFPFVMKIGSADAGFAKILIKDQTMLSDIKGTVTRYSEYITLEPYIQNRVCDFRLQRLGKGNYRCYKRNSTSGNWKGNVGTSIIEEVEVTSKMKNWCEWVVAAFPQGMEIVTLDFIRDEKGNDFILEVNDTASGLWDDNAKEDMKTIANIVLTNCKPILEKRGIPHKNLSL